MRTGHCFKRCLLYINPDMLSYQWNIFSKNVEGDKCSGTVSQAVSTTLEKQLERTLQHIERGLLKRTHSLTALPVSNNGRNGCFSLLEILTRTEWKYPSLERKQNSNSYFLSLTDMDWERNELTNWNWNIKNSKISITILCIPCAFSDWVFLPLPFLNDWIIITLYLLIFLKLIFILKLIFFF